MLQLHIDTEQPQFNPMLLGAGEIRLADTACGLTLGFLMRATMNKRKFISAVLAVPLLVAGAICASAQRAKPNLTIILDSSRSMWGQIDGINKVVSVRAAIGQLAKTHAEKLDLGLVSYGHRRTGGCSDIEVLLSPGAHKPAKITKTVNAIKPNGSTPIAEALKAAATAAKFKQRDASLLLISDGLDNCSGDPCAVAGALKAQAAGLSIHVIAFDRKEQASLKKLACIAKKTGGTFTPATGEAILLQAATAVADRVATPPAPAVAAPAPPSPPQTMPETTATVQLPEPTATVQLPEPTATVQLPEPTATMQPPAQPPQAAMAPPPDRKPGATPPEPQAAKAAKGDAATPEAPAKPTPVSLSATLVEGGEKLQNGLVWRVFEPKPTKGGKYKLVGSYREAEPTAALPPGEYLVNAAYGLAHLTKKIKILAGQSYQETFILNAGGLRLGATLTNGESIPPNSIRYDIFAGEADQFGTRKKILG
ncbi:MAG: VWA domain-containing protein, partial [Hyphomicrobiales bacterium]|nr:VWA domain-containing protein [Hyphomicrobiales bacterium]